MSVKTELRNDVFYFGQNAALISFSIRNLQANLIFSVLVAITLKKNMPILKKIFDYELRVFRPYHTFIYTFLIL